MTDFDGSQHAAVGEQRLGGAQVGRQPAVGARAGRPRLRSTCERCGRWPAPARAARAGRAPAAAHTSSTASTRRRLSTLRRSLRAAAQPFETWSSCIALVGSDCTDAGDGQPLVLHRHRRLRVVGDHQAAVDARRRSTGTAAGRASGRRRAAGRCAARRSPTARTTRSPGSRTRSRPARRGSCRSSRRARRAGSSGCRSPRRARARRSCGRGPACRARRRAPAACSAASTRPARGSRRTRWLATMAEPCQQPRQVAGAGRLPDLRAQRLQVGGEGAVGAEQPLDGHRRGHVGQAAQRRPGRAAPGTACRGCRRCR